ncbi:hypothetical protein [Haliangium sp.]|uniref:hypothetical protein n=1 Tax=Haliangium sp. TaxID=2663208 RepID=UPI003D09BD23
MRTVIALLVATLTGCASMFHGTSETLYIRSEEPDTSFYIGARLVGRGESAVVSVSKSDLGETILTARKKGCSANSVPVPTTFDGLTLLGFFLDFGIISILIVDWAATGAVRKAAQNDFILTPSCDGRQSVLVPVIRRYSMQRRGPPSGAAAPG